MVNDEIIRDCQYLARVFRHYDEFAPNDIEMVVLTARKAANAIEALTAERDAERARADRAEAAIKRQARAAKTLRKITLDEVQRLIDMDRSEYNAAKTLDSEREANAILTAQVEALTAERDTLRAKIGVSQREILNASMFAAELAESIGPSDEWSHDFKEGYVFGGRDAARMIRQKCTFPDAAINKKGPTDE